MPRITQERLLGYRFEVVRAEEQIADPKDGQPIFEANGDPKTVTMTYLAFVDDLTGHRIVVPFDEAGKQRLIESLTGGIVVPEGVLR